MKNKCLYKHLDFTRPLFQIFFLQVFLYFSFTVMTREPCGEDIADTETERSEDSDEDDYEDSFIDDDDPEVYPPSLISDGGGIFLNHFPHKYFIQDAKIWPVLLAVHPFMPFGWEDVSECLLACFLVVLISVVSEEMLDSERPKNGKGGRRRLRKRYQLSESEEEEECSQQKYMVNVHNGEPEFDSEDEDSIPISSFYNSKTTAKNTKEEANRDEKAMSETGKKNIEDERDYVSESTRKAGNVVEGQQKSIIEKSTEGVEIKTDKGTRETSDKEMEDDGNYTIQTKIEVLDAFMKGETKTPTKIITEDNFNHVIEPKRKADGLVDGQRKR